MTVMMLLAMLSILEDNTWRIGQSGVFQPLANGEVIVRSDGELYVLNFKEAFINHYDAAGRKKGTIGRKGRGPGEFTYPTRFCHNDGKLFVFDVMTGAISSFTEEGAFIKQYPVGRELQDMIKVENGWILVQAEREQPLEIYWTDNDFDKKERILRLNTVNTSGGVTMEMGPSGAVGVYSPIGSSAIARSNTDGSRIYVCEPGGFRVHVIDPIAKKVIAEIKRDEKRIPFDTEWADNRWKAMSKRMPHQDQEIDFTMDYPESFPVVRDFRVDYQGRLVFSKWMGRPDGGHHNLLVLDQLGNEQQIKLNWASVERVVAVNGKWAYVTTWDEDEEEAGLARCSLDALEGFLKANPINFEGQAGRQIRIRG